ncbi:MAG: archaeal heat shock protein Hsp20 [Thermoplasmatota archaeon]
MLLSGPNDPFRRRKGPSGPGGPDDPFGDFFAQFEDEFRDMQRMMGEVFQQAAKAAEDAMEQHKQGQPFVYGFTMRMGPDGKPHFDSFGNVQNVVSGGTPVGELPAREPLTDVIEHDKEISLTVELPGVQKEEINLHVSEDRISIRVEASGRFGRFQKTIPLPAKVRPETAEATYKNGILDLTIQRAGSAEDAGKRVSIK